MRQDISRSLFERDRDISVGACIAMLAVLRTFCFWVRKGFMMDSQQWKAERVGKEEGSAFERELISNKSIECLHSPSAHERFGFSHFSILGAALIGDILSARFGASSNHLNHISIVDSNPFKRKNSMIGIISHASH